MEFRIEKTACAALVLLALPAAAADLSYPVRHDHLLGSCKGTLVVGESGVSFQSNKHAWKWAYRDIQQLELAPLRLRVLTYGDNKWQAGADREYRFEALEGRNFDGAYAMLKDRLDQRFVAVLPDGAVAPLWELPAKHLTRFGGSEGVLLVGPDRIVYKSARADESRTWRYTDIDSISSSGPFQLTLTTYERAKSHYGSLKGFNFQLKEGLAEERYNDLWRRLNRKKETLRLPALASN
jgi:hypothetical protein